MANKTGRQNTADINLSVTPELKAQLSDIAWKNRISLRELCRSLLSTEVRIRHAAKKNPHIHEMFTELLKALAAAEKQPEPEPTADELEDAYKAGYSVWGELNPDGPINERACPTWYPTAKLQGEFERGYRDESTRAKAAWKQQMGDAK